MYSYRNLFFIPYIAGSAFFVGFKDIPIFLITTICGSSSVFLLSRLFDKWDMLAKLGRHSLIIYLFHFNIIIFVESKCILFIDKASTMVSAIAFCIIFAISLFGSYLVSVLINRYIPWLIGRNWN